MLKKLVWNLKIGASSYRTTGPKFTWYGKSGGEQQMARGQHRSPKKVGGARKWNTAAWDSEAIVYTYFFFMKGLRGWLALAWILYSMQSAATLRRCSGLHCTRQLLRRITLATTRSSWIKWVAVLERHTREQYSILESIKLQKHLVTTLGSRYILYTMLAEVYQLFAQQMWWWPLCAPRTSTYCQDQDQGSSIPRHYRVQYHR